MRNKLVKLAPLAFIVSLLGLSIAPLSASALTDLSVDVSVSSTCVSSVSPSTQSVPSGSRVVLTINNSDNVISQSVTGGGANGVTVGANNKNSSPQVTFATDAITSPETITFTPIPSSYNDPVYTNNCPAGSSTPVASTLTLTPIVVPTATPLATQSTTKYNTTTPQPTPTPATTTPQANNDQVTLKTASINGTPINKISSITINQSQSLKLSGTTVPNGLVTLTIHSTPKTVTTKADTSGAWSYTVTGLTVGNHIILASVTDPTNNQTTTPTQLVAFKVVQPQVVAIVKPTANHTKQYIIGGLLATLIIILIMVILLRNRKKSKTPVTTTIADPSSTTVATSEVSSAIQQDKISPTTTVSEESEKE